MSDELGWSVWKSKYAQEGEESPSDMHRRMAKEFARIEDNYFIEDLNNYTNDLSEYGKVRKDLTEDSIFNLFKDFKYIVPQGRVMAGLGVMESYRSLSNCTRLPAPKDSYSSIMYSDTCLVSAAKRGVGYGLSISNLRPKESSVKNAAVSSTGAVAFMERFSNSTREVGQSGRRGACLIDISINHPDVMDFINIKKDKTKVTGANISIFLNDEFLKAVENDEDYILRFPCNKVFDEKQLSFINAYDTPYNEIRNIENIIIKRIKAREYWNAIVESAKDSAEPGLFFENRMNDYSPSNVYEQYKELGTNACGEQPMAEGETCRLILLNLFNFVKDPFTDKAEIDFDLLYKMSYEQTRLGDDLVDLEVEYAERIINKIIADPEEDHIKAIELSFWKLVHQMASDGRRVGCGITALGDMIAALGLKYDSKEALDIVEQVMWTKMEAELDCSIDLAILRGTFVGWDKEKEYKGESHQAQNDFYQTIAEEFPDQFDRLIKYGRRNINISTVAPAGSVSILTQTSSGCEPLFQPYYTRRVKINPNDKDRRVDFVDHMGDSWTETAVLHPKFKDWINITYGEGILEFISKDELQGYFEKSPWYGSTANDIDWEKRIEMQSILQRYTSSAISSTLNLPQGTTSQTVSDIYFTAWKKGLKGVTIYVDGCRTGVLIDNNSTKKDVFEQRNAPKRPEVLPAEIHTTTSNGVKWNIIVGLMDSKPYEVFAVPYFTNETHLQVKKMKNGRYDLLKDGETYSENITSNMNDEQELITRMVSLGLRHGANITFIVQQLSKTSGGITSFGKALTRVLKRYAVTELLMKKENCNECGSTNLVYEEGCLKCRDCGNSKCG